MGRFSMSAGGTYDKYEKIGDVLYKISIPQGVWNSLQRQRIYKNVYYWISQKRIGKSPVLKYGSACIVDRTSLTSPFECTQCNKKYKTRSGFIKHVKRHHPVEEAPTETPPAPEVTAQNTEYQTINIRQNVSIQEGTYDTTEYETVDPSDEVGYVYCFSCESMPGIYKIGMTSRDVEKRLSDANKSSTWKPPSKYTHVMSKRVCNPYQKEKLIHNLLGDYRVNKKREFFKIDEFKLKCLFTLLPEASTD